MICVWSGFIYETIHLPNPVQKEPVKWINEALPLAGNGTVWAFDLRKEISIFSEVTTEYHF